MFPNQPTAMVNHGSWWVVQTSTFAQLIFVWKDWEELY